MIVILMGRKVLRNSLGKAGKGVARFTVWTASSSRILEPDDAVNMASEQAPFDNTVKPTL